MAANLNVHWRDSALTPKLYCFDARVSLSLVLLCLHFSYYTLGLFFVLIVISTVLNYFNLPLIVAWRVIVDFIGGRHKMILRNE
jgi:intracellular multiplication protein IcmT